MGYTTLIPHNARQMKENGDYEASHYRTWLKNENDYHKKAAFMRGHFDEIDKADAILVVNDEKHGRAGYIGGNVLIEMALAFYQNKPIYLLYHPDEKSPYLEEILGMEPIVLNGALRKIKL